MVPGSSVGGIPNYFMYFFMREYNSGASVPETTQMSMHHSSLETHAIFVHLF